MRHLFLLLVLALLGPAVADTEIVNARIPLPPSQLPDAKLTPIAAGQRETYTLSSNDTDVYFFASLQEGSWTARISWPASTPTRFQLTPLAHPDGAVFHVNASALSPRVPYFNPEGKRDSDFETTFHILVEPLLLGVVPRTAVSAVGAIVVCVGVAVLVASRFLRALQGFVRRIDEEELKGPEGSKDE
ncbi:hypothetical protein CspeluHIS016_0304200 [Cutaneotrichosporon spelunceum]|uniref:Protein PBN1 n=1 Tax=Cutaneotrichosporon spelunceum TaxID=1672016 RepID=A0AAD3TTG9_9TREE|nr:hypothetical protein CspeluHIS016_0304200 [Cutaneotrichosporon spelunceum]